MYWRGSNSKKPKSSSVYFARREISSPRRHEWQVGLRSAMGKGKMRRNQLTVHQEGEFGKRILYSVLFFTTEADWFD